VFRNRIEAGQRLGEALRKLHAERPVVLGLPRGGVVVGAEVARKLGCDLDALLVKKLRAPGNPELAIGAICEEGRAYLNQEIIAHTGATLAYLEAEKLERLAEMAAQRTLYRRVKKRVPATGRVVILVDDGLATGATMIAAVQATALTKPQRLIVAVPVAPPETITVIRAMPAVAEIVYLSMPESFSGVGQFYQDFRQVEDEEVVAILEEFA